MIIKNWSRLICIIFKVYVLNLSLRTKWSYCYKLNENVQIIKSSICMFDIKVTILALSANKANCEWWNIFSILNCFQKFVLLLNKLHIINKSPLFQIDLISQDIKPTIFYVFLLFPLQSINSDIMAQNFCRTVLNVVITWFFAVKNSLIWSEKRVNCMHVSMLSIPHCE